LLSVIIKISYTEANFRFYFWRTLAGNEVDLVLTQSNQIKVAIEIKAKKIIHRNDLSGLRSLKEEYSDLHNFIVLLKLNQDISRAR